MRQGSGQIGAEGRLYPPLAPFDQRRIDTGEGHSLYVEQCGNPDGLPVLVLHGGPGGGCSPYMRRFFDPTRWRVVLFDQRGCGRSTPRGSVEANTTADLIRDIDLIRATLGLSDVVLFGGSWGATLALAYAQARPDAVRALILRGVFLGQQSELDWFYGGGAGRFFPEAWQALRAPLPDDAQDDIIAAYHALIFGPDPAQAATAAQRWTGWENALAVLDGADPARLAPVPPDHAHVFARLESHYFAHRCFLDEGQLLRDVARMAHLPGIIIQGRYDMVCPPRSAYALAARWPEAMLRMIPASGHAMSEPRIARALLAATDEMAARLAHG